MQAYLDAAEALESIAASLRTRHEMQIPDLRTIDLRGALDFIRDIVIGYGHVTLQLSWHARDDAIKGEWTCWDGNKTRKAPTLQALCALFDVASQMPSKDPVADTQAILDNAF